MFTSTNIRVLFTLVGEVQGIKHNWAEFIVKQWKETTDLVKKVEGVDDVFWMKKKLRYASRVSYALSKSITDLDDRRTTPALVKPLFKNIVDQSSADNLDKIIRDAVALVSS